MGACGESAKLVGSDWRGCCGWKQQQEEIKKKKSWIMSGQCLQLEMLVATEKEVSRRRGPHLWLLLQCQRQFTEICHGDKQIGSLVRAEP